MLITSFNAIKADSAYVNIRAKVVRKWERPDIYSKKYALFAIDMILMDDEVYTYELQIYDNNSTYISITYQSFILLMDPSLIQDAITSHRRSMISILNKGSVSQPQKLWEKTWHMLSDDLLERQRIVLHNQDLKSTEDKLIHHALEDIEQILQSNNSSLSNFNGMPIPGATDTNTGNNLPEKYRQDITNGCHLTDQLLKTRLIIWDEAPMTHKFCIEAFDRSLRDVMQTSGVGDSNKPFGGKIVIFAGDFS
ncbi:hypothetical protein KSS87_016714 [Heliosperma pusillum]|nr:hypothetical protein KSS87_016714 [Heliosperma pusillum]